MPWTARSTTPARKARTTGSARTGTCPPSWPGRAAGTWTRNICSSTASGYPPACSTSACTSTTARSGRSTTAGAHTSTCLRSRVTSRRSHPARNAKALAKVRAHKSRESGVGFDGSWVAPPDLVPVCREVFDGVLGEQPNQLGKLRDVVSVSAADLLAVAKTPGAITEAGLRNNISVGLQYLAAWLGGNGAVAIFNLMEDAATAEISRSQVWQWLHNDIDLAEGPRVTRDLVQPLNAEELTKIR